MQHTNRILGLAISAALAAVMFAGAASAAELTIYPSSPAVQDGPVVGVANQSAPGFGTGSFEANGQTKTSIMLPASALFGGATVTVGDLASLSYWANGPAVTGNTPADWYINIYTAHVVGGQNDGSWYQHRLALEPYYSQNLDAPAGQWVQWSTAGDANGNNQLRIYDAFRGVGGAMQYGTYTDPFLSAVTGGPINWSDYSSFYANAVFNYTDDPIAFISISTGSGWASGFDGLLDGFTVGWTGADGKSNTSSVNFEAAAAAVPEPQHDLWMFGGGLALLGLGVLLRRRRGDQAA